jgi:hypothetical protein
MSIWPMETTLAQLESVLATSVEVRASATDLPITTTVSLQSILSEWEFPQQTPVLAQKLRQLRGLQLRCAPEARGLVEGYLETIATYAASRPRANATPAAKSRSEDRARGAAITATKQLNALDAQRETMTLRTARSTRAP